MIMEWMSFVAVEWLLKRVQDQLIIANARRSHDSNKREHFYEESNGERIRENFAHLQNTTMSCME